MHERLGAPVVEIRNKPFAFGFYSPEQVQLIIQAYIQTGSCEEASRVRGAFWSSATVSRVVREAVKIGVLPRSLKRETGRPKIDRGYISHAIQRHPRASDSGLARTIGVSVSTLYRAKRGG